MFLRRFGESTKPLGNLVNYWSECQDLCLFSSAIEFSSVLEARNAIYVLALCTQGNAQPGYRRRLSAQGSV